MAIDLTDKLRELQQMEDGINGPGSANRLIICSGTVTLEFPSLEQTFLWKVGPMLDRAQFHRATVTAGIGGITLRTRAVPDGVGLMETETLCRIGSQDADWDDDSNRVEVRIEASFSGPSSVYTIIRELQFQVMILASL